MIHTAGETILLSRKKLVEPIVIKLGGSAITFKDKPYSVNEEALVRISRILRSYYEAGGRMVLVHGGGSFGHQAVFERRSRKGVLDQRDVSMVQYIMLKLAVKVMDVLLEHGLPVTLYPGHALCRKKCQSISKLDYIIEDLENGLVPMTHGDIIYSDRGEYIISGDDLTLWIASAIGATRVYFVTSEPGVLGPKGEVIEALNSIDQVRVFNYREIDVTGGVIGKLEKALNYSLDHDVEIRVIDIEGLAKVLQGKPAGTLIKHTRRG